MYLIFTFDLSLRRTKIQDSLLERGRGLNWAAVPKVCVTNNALACIRICSYCSFLMLLFLPSDPCIIESLKHKCFLEELLFWTIKYEFPQKMVTFLLNMLPDQDYKVFFCPKRRFTTCLKRPNRNNVLFFLPLSPSSSSSLADHFH